MRGWEAGKPSGKISRAEKTAYRVSAEVVLMRSKPFPATELQLSSSTRGPSYLGRKTQGEEWFRMKRLYESLCRDPLAFRCLLPSCTCQMSTSPCQESGGLVCGAIETERCLTRRRESHWKSTYWMKKPHTSLSTFTPPLPPQSPYLVD